jgi:opacity protein-like surface antigen
MRAKAKILLTTGVLPLAATVMGEDFTNRVYVAADLGPAFQQNINISGGQEIDFNSGIRGDVSLGYRFKPWLAGEFAMGAIWNRVDTIGGVPMSSYGGSMDLYQIPLLGNVVLSAPEWHHFRPYVGGGIGCVLGKLDFNSPLGDIHDTDHTFAYQAFVGVNYQLSEHVAVGIGYKYLATDNHAWTQNGITLDTEGTMTHAVTCAVTWSF